MDTNTSSDEGMELNAPKRRRAPKGESRRAALLDAATQIIARDGYYAASLRDVADIAGISAVGLLYHFPNKPALLKALIERRDSRDSERFSELGIEPSLDGFVAFLRASMAMSVESEDECKATVMINVDSLSEKHPAFPWYQEKFLTVHGHAAAHLSSLKMAGQIRDDVDIASLAQEIFSVMDGIQIQWLRSPDRVDVMSVFDIYLDRLVRDIRAVHANHP